MSIARVRRVQGPVDRAGLRRAGGARRRPDRGDRGGRAGRPAQEHRRPPAGVARSAKAPSSRSRAAPATGSARRIVTLAAAVGPTRSMVAVARPDLEALAAAVGEAAGLSVPEGVRVHYVDQVDTPEPGRASATGRAPGCRCTRSRRASSCLPTSRRPSVERFLARPLEAFTPATVTDPAALRERLRRIQRDGYAWALERVRRSGSTRSPPAVADDDGEVVAAVHLHGPSYRFPEPGSEERIGAEVVAAAARISARLRHAGTLSVRRNGGGGEDPGRL